MIRALLILLVTTSAAFAHDDADWIRRGANSWCCGVRDCKVTFAHAVSLPAPGFRLVTGEFWPQDQTMWSVDENYWVCRADSGKGKIRCLFAPQPSM